MWVGGASLYLGHARPAAVGVAGTRTWACLLVCLLVFDSESYRRVDMGPTVSAPLPNPYGTHHICVESTLSNTAQHSPRRISSTHFTASTSVNRSSSFMTGGPLQRWISASVTRPTTSSSPSALACRAGVGGWVENEPGAKLKDGYVSKS